MSYLEEAAALLRKAAETNETACRGYTTDLNKGRERIAMKFAQLGAIEHGVIPAEMVGDLMAALIRSEVSS